MPTKPISSTHKPNLAEADLVKPSILNKKLLARKIQNKFQNWLKRLVNFKSNHSLEETVSEIIEEYNPNRQKMTAEEQKILHNFLEFGSKKVSDIAISRSDICAVKLDATIDNIVDAFNNFAHTRIIVYNEDLDDIAGFIHIKDLIPILAGKRQFNLSSLLRKTILVAPSMKLHDLLAQMQKQRIHIAIAVDEYGGTYGIVTMEDIIEVIFGEIDDEHDVENNIKQYKIINNNMIIADARMDIKNLEEILKLKLKTNNNDFETVGGLILSKHGHMPKKGAIINITSNINAEIIDVDPRSLKLIKILIDNTID